MKRIKFLMPATTLMLTLILASVNGVRCPAQEKLAGIHFFEGTFKDALTKAKAEKKALFFDAYASWCGPCKHMDADVYSLPEVGKFFNDNFVCIRVDMEKGEGPDLAKKLTSIDGYPSLLFFSPDGHLVKTIYGSRSPSALMAEANLVLAK
ncbi:MAG: thioredoxin family protein [Bacteroidetes bacterium]|nr:thioredoxin family protein [Bacteroidota bacterium]